MDRITHLLVRVEFGLGCNHGGEFLGRLLLGDDDACTAHWSGLHPGCHLPCLVGAVPLVPHGSVGTGNIPQSIDFYANSHFILVAR